MAIKENVTITGDDTGNSITYFTQRAEGKNIYPSDIKYFINSETPFLKDKNSGGSINNTPVRKDNTNKPFLAYDHIFTLNSAALGLKDKNYYKTENSTSMLNVTYLKSVPLSDTNKNIFGMYIKNTYWGAEEDNKFYYNYGTKKTAIPFVSYINGQMPKITLENTDYKLKVDEGLPVYQTTDLNANYEGKLPEGGLYVYLVYYDNACYYTLSKVKVKATSEPTPISSYVKVSEGPGVFLAMCGAGGGGGSCSENASSSSYAAGGGGGGASAVLYLDLKFISQDLKIYNKNIRQHIPVDYVCIEIGRGGRWGDSGNQGYPGGPTVLYLQSEKQSSEVTNPTIQFFLPGGLGGSKNATNQDTYRFGYGGGEWNLYAEGHDELLVKHPPIYFRNTFNNAWDNLQGIVNNNNEKLYMINDYLYFKDGKSNECKASSLDNINQALNNAGIHLFTAYTGLPGGSGGSYPSATLEGGAVSLSGDKNDGKQGRSFTKALLTKWRGTSIASNDPLYNSTARSLNFGRLGEISSPDSAYPRNVYGGGNWRWYRKDKGPSGGGGGASMLSKPYLKELDTTLSQNDLSIKTTAWDETNSSKYITINLSPNISHTKLFASGYGSYGGGGSGGVSKVSLPISSLNFNQNKNKPGQGTRGESGVVIFLPLN